MKLRKPPSLMTAKSLAERNPPATSRTVPYGRMKLLVGLGNPGKRYAHTPHNAGWMALDTATTVMHAPVWTNDEKRKALVTRAKVGRTTILLAKPTVFMNLSGESVVALVRFFHIQKNNLWIVHDDVDLPLGSFRHSFNSRSAGHRGVQSIIDALGTKAFHRIRIGVGRDQKMPTDAFVTHPFSKELQRELHVAVQTIVEQLPALLASSHG